MRFRAIVEYEYPVEHKPPVKADIYLHGDKVTTGNIKPFKAELEEIKAEIQNLTTNNFLEMISKGEAIQIVDNHIKELNNDTK